MLEDILLTEESRKQRYLKMFQGPASAEYNPTRAINNAIRWFDKENWNIWYLRWERHDYLLRAWQEFKDDESPYATKVKEFAKRQLGTEPKVGLVWTERAYDAMQHFTSMPFKQQLLDWDPGWKTPEEVVDRWREIEEEWRENVEGESLQTPSEEGTERPFISLDSKGRKTSFAQAEWVWWDLGRGYCRAEGDAMGHCGNAGGGNGTTILSLRKRNRAIEGYWEPHLTFILGTKDRTEGWLGEMKGRGNDKPAARFHKFIVPLLKDARIVGIAGGGYLPENNFSLSHLPEAQRDSLVKMKPTLGTLRDIHKVHGLNKDWINKATLLIEDNYHLRDGFPKKVGDMIAIDIEWDRWEFARQHAKVSHSRDVTDAKWMVKAMEDGVDPWDFGDARGRDTTFAYNKEIVQKLFEFLQKVGLFSLAKVVQEESDINDALNYWIDDFDNEDREALSDEALEAREAVSEHITSVMDALASDMERLAAENDIYKHLVEWNNEPFSGGRIIQHDDENAALFKDFQKAKGQWAEEMLLVAPDVFHDFEDAYTEGNWEDFGDFIWDETELINMPYYGFQGEVSDSDAVERFDELLGFDVSDSDWTDWAMVVDEKRVDEGRISRRMKIRDILQEADDEAESDQWGNTDFSDMSLSGLEDETGDTDAQIDPNSVPPEGGMGGVGMGGDMGGMGGEMGMGPEGDAPPAPEPEPEARPIKPETMSDNYGSDFVKDYRNEGPVSAADVLAADEEELKQYRKDARARIDTIKLEKRVGLYANREVQYYKALLQLITKRLAEV